MNAPKLARAAAELLAKEELELELVAPAPNERERMVQAIESELSLRAERGKRRRWARPLLAFAAAAVLVVGAKTWSQRGATVEVATPVRAANVVVAEMVRGAVFVEENGQRVALRATTPLPRGSTVVAMDGEALLLLPSGSKVDVEHATIVSVLEDGEGELLSVERGAVTSTVTKRGPGQRFVIRTPDAEVEVRGTVFRVSRLDDARCGMQTRVHVDEGRVVVRAPQNGTTLERGGEWTSP
jgi:ferric-dicitrate binding protein FerR (iron transport regulator)